MPQLETRLPSAAEVRPEPAPEKLSWAERIEGSVAAASRRLFDIQHDDGHWCAELEGDTILESEYALLLHFLGRTGDERFRQAANYLRSRQLADGGWAIYPDGPTDVSASAKAYLVLKLAGDDPAAAHMSRAREAILAGGGLDACNSFTKLYLSIFGQYDWLDSPGVPPEIILFPSWFPFFNIYEMSSWSRAIVVPLSIIWATKPRCPMPAHAAIPELRVATARVPIWGTDRGRVWAGLFRILDRVHKIFERLHLVPLRRLAIRRCERWILERLEASDGLGAIFPPILNVIFAFRALGYPADHPVILSQIEELEKLEIEEGETLRLQPCKSPVWDTALALNALAEVESDDHPAILAAVDWMLAHEVRQPGDWQVKSPEAPVGGWYFEYANEFYPDCDDTAQVLTALSKLEIADGERKWKLAQAKERAKGWLLAMQNRDGGWASFDKDCDREYLTYIPFADHNAMIDPSTTDITSRVLEALAGLGHDMSSPEVTRGATFIRQLQEADGSWYGRWGSNYIYGTWLALWGLRLAGDDPSAEWMRRGADWLTSCQNADGGWGETLASYDDPALKGQGPSTAAQTAWALLGLAAAGQAASASVRHGVEYLLASQEADGGWTDEPWTGTGFPKVFYLRYHLYATYFPLLALAIIREAAQRPAVQLADAQRSA